MTPRIYRGGFHRIYPEGNSCAGLPPPLWGNSTFYLRARSLPGVDPNPFFSPILDSTVSGLRGVPCPTPTKFGYGDACRRTCTSPLLWVAPGSVTDNDNLAPSHTVPSDFSLWGRVCVFPVCVLRSSGLAACAVPCGPLSAALCVGRSCGALWSVFRTCFLGHTYAVCRSPPLLRCSRTWGRRTVTSTNKRSLLRCSF